ncbi:MAG: HlyC/CorC family transporter [Xanthomonadales bacterium]|nr:HlyC/CorC family transporter [Xanthomonadales bacterium]NNL94466.1 HlyC/CorC family transporter [Xanthomonadales bacterium]
MDDIPIGSLYGALLILIILSGFFSSSETGLMAVNRYRLRHLANENHAGARLAQNLLHKPDRLIGLILLGNNLVNILAASIATVIAIRIFGDNGIWISTLVMTVVVLIFAELAPKTVAALHPEKIAIPASYVLTPLLKVFYPVVWTINGLVNLMLKPLGIRTNVEMLERLNREELRTLVKEGGQISNAHQRMLLNILDLEQAEVDDVMVPRGEIIGIDLDDDWEEVLQQLAQTLYTRLPVYRESVDHIEGLLHIRTIIAKLSQGSLSFEDLQKSVRKPYFIPEGTSLTRQLLEFQKKERRMGLVVDEYGDIQGLVTLDDILEEIVGEYTPDGRERSRSVRKLADGNYLVDGTASLRTLNRRMGWQLPNTEAHTLSGLLVEEMEAIPEGQASIRISDHIMTVVDIRDNMIRKVLVKPHRARAIEPL